MRHNKEFLMKVEKTKRKKNSLEKNPEFNFKTVEELSHLTLEEKEKILSDIDYLIRECELSRKTIIEENDLNNIETDRDWLKRVNFKIGIKRSQRKILSNHIRQERGVTLIESFFDIAKIILPEDTFNSILGKAKNLSRVQNGE